MNNSTLRNLLDEAKLNLDCRDFLGIHCSEGQAVCAPQFVRTDDNHPSFAVYKDHCFDFATNSVFDIFDLKMLRDNQSLPEAFLDLTGKPLYTPRNHELNEDANDDVNSAQRNLARLNNNIIKWNNALLNDPIITFKGKQMHLLSEYLASRGITRKFCEDFLIGYSSFYNRVIFPCFKNGRVVAWAGRELTGDTLPKYLKPKLDNPDHFGYEFVPWGLNTLRNPTAKSTRKVLGDDGNTFDQEVDNPKDYTLVIVEGAFDWAAFAQEGWQAISPLGGHFRKKLYPFIISLAKNYKQVFLCFDNDAAGQSFQLELAKLFFEHRIKFICGHTHNPDGSAAKFDINDYYSAGGNLDDLVKSANPGIIDYANSFDDIYKVGELLEKSARFASTLDLSSLKVELMRRVKPNPDYNPADKGSDPFIPFFDPWVLKELFRSCKAVPPELDIVDEVLAKYRIIYNFGDSFYHYKGGKWNKACNEEILGFILKILGKKATNGKARAIMKDLMSVAGQYALFDQKHIVAFTNGVLDLESGVFYKHSPDFMNTIKLNYAYSSTALAPHWNLFIHQIAQDKHDVMKQLQKAAGYVLFADNSLQKMFALFGTGANGKSVYTEVLEQVYGSENTSHVRIDSLNSPFEGIHLEGKLLNISHESKKGLNGSEDILKAVVSGDPIMAAHKGIDSVSFSSRAKWFVNLNNILETTDISWGFLRRLIFLPFNATFNGKDANPHLAKELLKELPGIFNWCYEGYRMLREDMSFEELDEATKILEEMMKHVNSSFAFFCESFREDANNYLKHDDKVHYPTSDDMFGWYKNWCKENGEKQESKRIFLERFKAALVKYRPDVEISAPYHEEGVRGKLVKYYFPEFVPTLDEDYFATRRDPATGEYIQLESYAEPSTDEFMAAMQTIDAEKKAGDRVEVQPVSAEKAMTLEEVCGEVEAAEKAELDKKKAAEEAEKAREKALELGRQLVFKAVGLQTENKDWWSSLTDYEWACLKLGVEYYRTGTWDAGCSHIGFDEHYADYLRRHTEAQSEKGDTSAQ